MRARLLAASLALALACGGVDTYRAAGVVEDLDPALGQIRIAHDDIPGFMPAMTMSFDVEPALLVGVAPGDRISFALERGAEHLRVVSVEVTGRGEAQGRSAAPAGLGGELAPEIRLVDHAGRPFALSELRGRAVLLDFVFTRCQGPCPILTASHAQLQRRLPEELRARAHFVSVSLDPAYDTPERLQAYALARGCDLETWTFLTGKPGDVQAVLDAYGVGTLRTPDGTLDHLVATFLIAPDGRIARRYVGLEHRPGAVLADLQEVLS